MAYEFDGVNDYISAAGAVGIATAHPITIAAWYRTTTTSWTTAEAVCGISDDDGNPYNGLIIGVTGSPAAQTRTNTGSVSNLSSAATSTIAANTWTHLVGTFVSNASRTLYVDGVAATTNTTSATMTTADFVDIDIGRARRATEIYAKGRIAEVGFWSATLTQDEISALAKGASPSSIRPQSLFFYAPLVRDAIELRNGSTLTVSGATVAEHPRIYK